MDNEKPYPPCFGSRLDYERWLDSFAARGELAASHCTDCLPSFKARMQACGRCEHPETFFQFEYESGFDEDDGGLVIHGAWKRLAQHRGPRAIAIKKSPIAVPAAQPESFWQRQERLHRERLAMRR